jgi:hypothetical protein
MSGPPPTRSPDPPEGPSQDDVFPPISEYRGSPLLLGTHPDEDVRGRLEACGVIDRLAELGFRSLLLEISPYSVEGQTLRLYDEAPEPGRLLIDLRLRIEDVVPSLRFVTGEPLREVRMLRIEWLALQNPRGAFTPERPPLPDQSYPGLGLGEKAVRFLGYLARDHRCDGLLSFPDHYHNAVMYARRFLFFHPARHGAHQGMMRDLQERTLADRSFAIDAGCLWSDPGHRSEAWVASEMVLPISRRLLEIVRARFWRREEREAEGAKRWGIDWERYDRRKEADGPGPTP